MPTPESTKKDASTSPTAQKAVRGWKRFGARLGTRLGVAAFLFFFVKGLAWIVVPVALAAWMAK